MGSAFPTIQSWLLTINLKEHMLKMAAHYEAMLFSNCSIFSIRMCLVYICRYYLGLCSIIFFFTNRMLLFIPMTSFESRFTFSKICYLPIYQIISMGSHKRHNLSYQDTSSFEIVPSRTAMEIRQQRQSLTTEYQFKQKTSLAANAQTAMTRVMLKTAEPMTPLIPMSSYKNIDILGHKWSSPEVSQIFYLKTSFESQFRKTVIRKTTNALENSYLAWLGIVLLLPFRNLITCI